MVILDNYKFTKTGPKAASMVCDNPYPDAFDLGIIESVASKFRKPDENVSVKIDGSKSQRDEGAESTTFSLSFAFPIEGEGNNILC